VIGPAGGVALGEGLAGNACIKSLNLAFNDVCDDGATAIGKAMITNRSLTELDLRSNHIVHCEALGQCQLLPAICERRLFNVILAHPRFPPFPYLQFGIHFAHLLSWISSYSPFPRCESTSNLVCIFRFITVPSSLCLCVYAHVMCTSSCARCSHLSQRKG
jgi:hypothetical protein